MHVKLFYYFGSPMFIDRVVGQMHVELFYVGVLRGGVGFCGEADEAVVVEEDAERVAGSDENVNPKVEFVTVDQKWFVAIFLDDHVIVLGNLNMGKITMTTTIGTMTTT